MHGMKKCYTWPEVGTIKTIARYLRDEFAWTGGGNRVAPACRGCHGDGARCESPGYPLPNDIRTFREGHEPPSILDIEHDES